MADHNVNIGADHADLIKLTDETITEKIRQMLVNGAFDAEATITETNLSRKLGVSRTPVRTALKVLAAEGFLTARDGRGYIARAFSKKDILHAVKVRGVLEALAAQQVAEVGLSAVDIDRLDRSLEMTNAIVTRGIIDKDAIEAFQVANAIFHKTIARAADNSFIEDSLGRLQILPQTGVGDVFFSLENEPPMMRLTVSHSQHVIIKQAIDLRDGGRAFAMMREHASSALEYYDLFSDE